MIEITMEGVREYCEEKAVKLGVMDNGRLIIDATNEGGHNGTAVDLLDLLTWLETHKELWLPDKTNNQQPVCNKDTQGGYLREDIIDMAREAGCHEASHPMNPWSVTQEALERFFHAAYAAGAKAEQDRCCKIVYGMAGSDNVAQRTVDAIRRKE